MKFNGITVLLLVVFISCSQKNNPVSNQPEDENSTYEEINISFIIGLWTSGTSELVFFENGNFIRDQSYNGRYTYSDSLMVGYLVFRATWVYNWNAYVFVQMPNYSGAVSYFSIGADSSLSINYRIGDNYYGGGSSGIEIYKKDSY